MENQISNTPNKYNKNTVAGFILLIIGLGILLGRNSLIFFPHFVFSWPVIMTIIGLGMGFRHNFQKSNWIVITAIGVLFLLPNIIPSLHIVVLWPLVLIAFGIRLLTRHSQYWNGNNWQKRNDAV